MNLILTRIPEIENSRYALIQTLPRLTHIQKRMLQKMRTQWTLQEGMMKELLGGSTFKGPSSFRNFMGGGYIWEETGML